MDRTSCTIRQTVLTDAAALVRFRAQIVRQTEFMLKGAEDPQGSLLEQAQWVERFAAHPTSMQCCAVTAHGVIVGLGSITGGEFLRNRHVGTLSVGVLQSHWRRGLGQALVQTCLDWARVNRLMIKLNLQVHASNGSARQLYAKLGFEVEGILRREAKLGNNYDDLIAMGLWLRRRHECAGSAQG